MDHYGVANCISILLMRNSEDEEFQLVRPVALTLTSTLPAGLLGRKRCQKNGVTCVYLIEVSKLLAAVRFQTVYKRYRLDSTGQRQDLRFGFCENCDRPSDSVITSNFLRNREIITISALENMPTLHYNGVFKD